MSQILDQVLQPGQGFDEFDQWYMKSLEQQLLMLGTRLLFTREEAVAATGFGQAYQLFTQLSADERRSILRTPELTAWLLQARKMVADEQAATAFLTEFSSFVLLPALRLGLKVEGLQMRTDATARLRLPGQVFDIKCPDGWEHSDVRVERQDEQVKFQRVATEYTEYIECSVYECLTPLLSSHSHVELHRNLPGTAIYVTNDREWISEELERARLPHEGEQLYKRPYQGRIADVVLDFERALQRVKQVSTEMFEDILLNTYAIAPMESNYAVGFSSSRLHGVLFLTYYPGDIDRLAEELIHENGHQRLIRLMQFCKLFTNPEDELYPSPFRQDRRPIGGLLHGTFVFVRVMSYYVELLRQMPGLAFAIERIADIREQLHDGMTTLQMHATWTAEGQQVFRTMEEAIERLDADILRLQEGIQA